MEFSTTLLFITFLLLPSLTHLSFVPTCGTLTTTGAKKPPIHVAAIVESDTGTLGIINHAFLFHQLHCALKEQHSAVQIDGWKIDGGHGSCTNIETDDPTENIIEASSFASPPEHSRTLCEILDYASKCAHNYKGHDKLHIVTGLLLHDEIGECDIEKQLPTVNFHLTVFWVHGHRKPPSVHSKIVDYAILESLTDISPRSGWFLPDGSLEQLHEAQQLGDSNPILDSLYLRLKRMSDASKVPIVPRKSRRLQRLSATTTIPSNTSSEIDTVEKENVIRCRMAAAAEDNNKIKKRFADNNENDSTEVSSSSKLPCDEMAFMAAVFKADVASNGSPSSTPTTITTGGDGSTSTPTGASGDGSSSATTTNPASAISTTDTSITTTAIYSSISTEIFNSTPGSYACHSIDDASVLEKFGCAFGDRHNGILYLLFIIFIALIILCGISLLVCCLWPKYYHDEVHSRKPRSKKAERLVKPEVAAIGGGTAENTRKTKTMSAESVKNKNNKKKNSKEVSKEKMDSSANKMKSTEAVTTTSKKAKKSPVKSILKKSPNVKTAQQKKLTYFPQEPSSALHSDPERSLIDRTAIEIPPPMSPAGITPAPSNISYAENTNMKFNDKKDLEAPPLELQPTGMNNNNDNNPFQI